MNPSAPVLSGQQLALINQTRLCLNQRFETAFSVWFYDEQGLEEMPGYAEQTQPKSRDQLAALLRQTPLAPGVICHTQEDGSEWIVHIESAIEEGHVLIAGHVQPTRQQLIRQLAENARQEAQQTLELKDSRGCLVEYADQVTNDFEELAWLRGLAEHIEACDLSSDLQTVSQAILPPLRELINAECIALIHQVPQADAEPSYECSYLLGTLPVDMDDCARLIQSCDGQQGHPMVRNATHLIEGDIDTFGLRNFILVPIARSGSRFGWLLVANRAMLGNSADDLRVNASCLSGWEFGTFEAGVVNAAAVMLGTHARNSQLFREREDLLLGVVRALINAVDAKDAYTCGHSDRVALIAQQVARKMQLGAAECERIYMAGLLHDIGKIGIPDDVLCKAGRLTDAEYEIIKQHPEIGYSILRHVKQLEYVLPGVLHHHESFDGTGYPQGLAGEAIPLYGRVLAVADAFDAMTSTRSYRRAMDREKAKDILREGAGSQWDPLAVEAFFQALPEIEKICENYQPHKYVADADDNSYGSRVSDPFDALTAALTALESV
ncbi:HD-GYP domain-containing protein [Roseimaritima ulvae]|uniref:Cyclic di-GMP phosphodiesterase response regulator RpfG n=1 Tax=Roseimaritima ulvae TaxID=980254 RepID=A0A5B9R121_9BACT|nr:HD-GYP domain-containing protein [Roseimaritima ulvae]QEG43475.1 Cyclic di-GMP phosphodiesterase response regulator RpfG [Roseimaritima ulvae]